MGAKILHENEDNELKGQVEETKANRRKTNRKKLRIRAFPIWLRIVVVLILSVLALALGLMVGFGIIGDGNAMEVFKIDTWQHIIDIVKKEA